MVRRRSLVLLGSLLLTLPPRALAQSPLTAGVWEDLQGGVRVAFVAADPTRLRGEITWIRDTIPPESGPATDLKNPDPALRSRPIIGLPMLNDMQPDGEGQWSGGTIYDARNGKTYRATLRLVHPDTLLVRGYLKVGFVKVGRTARWIRRPAEGAR